MPRSENPMEELAEKVKLTGVELTYLVERYQEISRHYLKVAKAIHRLNVEKSLPWWEPSPETVIEECYYSMLHAATAFLVAKGWICYSHIETVEALRELLKEEDSEVAERLSSLLDKVRRVRERVRYRVGHHIDAQSLVPEILETAEQFIKELEKRTRSSK